MKYKFNHKYIKENAKPGSWRRGYEYFQKGQVTSVELKDAVVKAQVKGNFKSHYDVTLKFNKKNSPAIKLNITKKNFHKQNKQI